MKTHIKSAILLLTILTVAGLQVFGEKQPLTDQRADAKKLMKQGNWKEAYNQFHDLVLAKSNTGKRAGEDLNDAIQCLNRLGRYDEFDELVELSIQAHQKDWHFLQAAANAYIRANHRGYIVAGKFYRGHRRGGGKYVSSFDRDRVRALQLMDKAMPLADQDQDVQAVSEFYLNFADHLLRGYNGASAWRLQTLTDYSTLPDYEEGYGYYRHNGYSQRGAPVDEAGNPVYHHVPETRKASKTDGERWRWMLTKAMQVAPENANKVNLIFADFLHNQFGVQTIGNIPMPLVREQDHAVDPDKEDSDKEDSDKEEADANPYALHTLKQNETIAKLATGAKRFELPDEFNFIKIYQNIAENGKSNQGESSLDKLAGIFENRRQYPKAAEYWEKAIRDYGPGNNLQRKNRLEQIVGNWGRFEYMQTKPAGQNAEFQFRFRNSTSVRFTAKKIDMEKLLSDVKKHLRSNPKQPDWQKLNISNVGYTLVHKNQKQYLGDEVANWDKKLIPAENHYDRRATIASPLKKAGAYFVTAKVKDGNESHIIIWLTDTAIAYKQLNGKRLYYVADAVSGKPIAKANLEFFGYRNHYQNRKRWITVTNFAEFTDANGQVIPSQDDLKANHSWLVIARTDDGRFAYHGFDSVWYNPYHHSDYDQNKVFMITDRPVYRPKQKVNFKFWVRKARYDQHETSRFGDKKFTVRLTDPKGKKVFEKEFMADGYGGFDGNFELADDATLGNYSLQIVHDKSLKVGGGGSFRVEEYKKPEFEVTIDAPDKPVMLGEKITAKINAKYYFGAPVTQAKVKYKVTRNAYDDQWYPVGRWDWFYGPGYWWFAEKYDWYPGWGNWVGCVRPWPPWWGHRSDPPEVVLENEVEISEDGTVDVEIDTALAKAMHGDQDHKYSITAEVVDRSRRTIVGTGNVLVARKPFKVFSWVNRGHYQVGDTIQANFKAQTLDTKPVAGTGKLTLYSIAYDENGKPTETEVFQVDLGTDEQGEADYKFKAANEGQYRLSYKVTDDKKHTIEGGYIFNVLGPQSDGLDYRYNDLELVLDKKEYEPGDQVRVLINTNRPDSTVLLFLRATNGIYPKPIMLKLQGKSLIHEVAVVQKDMPNFFIEAITIAQGKLHTQTQEVIVPPEKRVANIEILPSAADYRPGSEATIKMKLTDYDGKPFHGSTVVSIYDKSVEYISGGSNISEIKAFFWKWRRHHHPSTITNLTRTFRNLVNPKEKQMNNIGAFGHLVDEKLAEEQRQNGAQDKLKDLERDAKGFGGAPGKPQASSAYLADDSLNSNRSLQRRKSSPHADNRDSGDWSGDAAAEPTVRKNFADTALWAAAVSTDASGVASVSLKMPENLTTWKIRAWTMGHGTRVGQGEADVVTSKNLIVRLQAPRFFVETDEVVLSANVHNYLKTEKQAKVELALAGETLSPIGNLSKVVTIPAGGETRVDWRVKVTAVGEATITMKALTDEESDAMQMAFPVYVHGMLKTESYTGVIKPDQDSTTLEVSVPAARQPEKSRLEVRFSPTLAGAMVDALPYLVSYPHKTSDTTLHRFLPTVMTQNILKRMNLNLKEIQKKRTNLNAQEIGDAAERAKRWKHDDHNPVFDEAKVERMVKQGLKDLTSMQQADGGWGWFYGFGSRSTPHMTALIVHGLHLAQENGVAIVPDTIQNGETWLKKYQERQATLLRNHARWDKMTPAERRENPIRHKQHADNLDAFIYMVLSEGNITDDEMNNFLYRDRTKLAVYAKALYGLALHKEGDQDKLKMIIRNIDQFLMQDDENETAYLKLPTPYWWYWYGSEIEANAYYLKLLSLTDPEGEKASRLAKYVINNRRYGTYWKSTRDTAIAIEALATYMKASRQDAPEMTVELYYDGQKQKEVNINADNLFSFDNRLVLTGRAITDGKHKVELKRKGSGRLYYNAYMTNFTREDFITNAGLEIKVGRKFYKLTRDDKQQYVAGSRGQAVQQRVEKYKREELKSGTTIEAGDLIEVELEIDSKNDYEYLIFDDMKVAGFEPVALRSGYNSNSMGAYMELRDERVTFFTQWLARGKHSVSYRLRAEFPGKFSALPAKGKGMYAPELIANSDEWKIQVKDADLVHISKADKKTKPGSKK